MRHDVARETARAFVTSFLVTFVLLLAVLALAGCSAGEEEPTWPDSAEFSTIETGAERFSVHLTNLGKWRVLVDHETGVQYIVGNTANTICPLLDSNGSPLLVSEAGE